MLSMMEYELNIFNWRVEAGDEDEGSWHHLHSRRPNSRSSLTVIISFWVARVAAT